MCFRTSVLKHNNSVSGCRRRKRRAPVFILCLEHCLACLLVIVSMLAQLTGISGFASADKLAQAQGNSNAPINYFNETNTIHSRWSDDLQRSPVRATISINGDATNSRAPAPIRHWWALHHHKRSSSLSSQSKSPSSSSQYYQLFQQPQDHPKCLKFDEHVPEDSVLHLRNGAEWAEEVCRATPLDKRVKMMLSASPCDQHKVCQVLSPTDLQKIASDRVTCVRLVEKWWKKFHAIERALVEFDEIFAPSLDIDEYSIIYDVKQCKAAYQFWVCSMHLPLYLTPVDPDDDSDGRESPREPVEIEACGSVCRDVEAKCPFFILGTEGDKAAGNPSFICKDEEIPPLFKSSDPSQPSSSLSVCCYKAVSDPGAGEWISINATDSRRPFCIEPDTLRSRRTREKKLQQQQLQQQQQGWYLQPQQQRQLSTSRPSMSSALPPMSSESDLQDYSSSLEHFEKKHDDDDDDDDEIDYFIWLHQHCDKLPTPSANLNVTSIYADEWKAWSHLESNASIATAAAAMAEVRIDFGDTSDEDHRLFTRIKKIFGFSSSSSASCLSRTKSSLWWPVVLLASLAVLVGSSSSSSSSLDHHYHHYILKAVVVTLAAIPSCCHDVLSDLWSLASLSLRDLMTNCHRQVRSVLMLKVRRWRTNTRRTRARLVESESVYFSVSNYDSDSQRQERAHARLERKKE